jgi:hypothetical protein
MPDLAQEPFGPDICCEFGALHFEGECRSSLRAPDKSHVSFGVSRFRGCWCVRVCEAPLSPRNEPRIRLGPLRSLPFAALWVGMTVLI